jgi:hypothetical protein
MLILSRHAIRQKHLPDGVYKIVGYLVKNC